MKKCRNRVRAVGGGWAGVELQRQQQRREHSRSAARTRSVHRNALSDRAHRRIRCATPSHIDCHRCALVRDPAHHVSRSTAAAAAEAGARCRAPPRGEHARNAPARCGALGEGSAPRLHSANTQRRAARCVATTRRRVAIENAFRAPVLQPHPVQAGTRVMHSHLRSAHFFPPRRVAHHCSLAVAESRSAASVEHRTRRTRESSTNDALVVALLRRLSVFSLTLTRQLARWPVTSARRAARLDAALAAATRIHSRARV